jgi:hypothetical protein
MQIVVDFFTILRYSYLTTLRSGTRFGYGLQVSGLVGPSHSIIYCSNDFLLAQYRLLYRL